MFLEFFAALIAFDTSWFISESDFVKASEVFALQVCVICFAIICVESEDVVGFIIITRACSFTHETKSSFALAVVVLVFETEQAQRVKKEIDNIIFFIICISFFIYG
jgi:hypothetical protein